MLNLKCQKCSGRANNIGVYIFIEMCLSVTVACNVPSIFSVDILFSWLFIPIRSITELKLKRHNYLWMGKRKERKKIKIKEKLFRNSN